MNQTQLAKKYGVTRQAVAYHVKRLGSLPGADEALSQSLRPEVIGGPLNQQYHDARTRKMVADANLSEMEAGLKAGRLVEVCRVLEAQGRIMDRIKSVIDGRRSEICAKLGGAPADRQDAMWKRVHDEIFSELDKPLFEK